MTVHVITCCADQRWLPMCRASVEVQTASARHVVWIDDPCDPRGVVASTISAIEASGAAPDDVLAIVDGDDWLCHDQALALVLRSHEAGALVTYGSWVSNHRTITGPMPPYGPGADYRRDEWRGTALRTMRRQLYDLIDPSDLLDIDGRPYRYCPDLAIHLPCLEMAGPGRTAHIPEIIYMYNRASGTASEAVASADKRRIARRIRTIPPYLTI